MTVRVGVSAAVGHGAVAACSMKNPAFVSDTGHSPTYLADQGGFDQDSNLTIV